MLLLNKISFISVILVGILFGVLSKSVAGDSSPHYGPTIDQRGKWFYSRYAFLEAIKPYIRFARRTYPGREIAAFFAHVTHETGHFCHIEENGGESRDYFDEGNRQYPCAWGKKYHETVSKDPIIAYKTALWFWMKNVHKLVASNQGFGATIRAINSMECNGGNWETVQARHISNLLTLNRMSPLTSITFISIVGVLLRFLSQNVKADELYPPYGPLVSERVTPQFFYGILNQAKSGCPGKNFYTRHAFLDAVNMHPRFGRRGQPEREIAAFFAHVTHETGRKITVPRMQNFHGKRYYGRGPLQLSYNTNYGPAGNAIHINLLQNPEIVANDPSVAFKTSLWFWMTYVHKTAISPNQGFGNTIRIINSGECDGGNPAQVDSRVMFYREYCNLLGTQPEDNLRC
ncbi:hypothetical protein MKW98_028988 [Papaver atlanticum]|uniref:Glycoside hydrolase family 19 catalytic domain-containing protein n=1 Tax=Papaver atlanticum TaxID=357466 RepID=A0AAD4XYK3_9MAGN|nr:hypothetical protein MKW98_028988 [Papaver atlanticum]